MDATINLKIDGFEIETKKGKTVLAAALDAGIYIPHLCHHPDLAPLGACRVCVVEIAGLDEMVTSCTTPAEEGMEVKTKTAGIERIRRLALELSMAAHPSDCTACPKYLKCELQSLTQYLGITDSRLRRRPREVPVDTRNPLFLHDLTRCVLCGRCVRACHELRGVKVLNYIKKSGETFIGIGNGETLLADAGCRFCGACVEICPAGALRDQEGLIEPDINRKSALVPCKRACPAGIDIPRYLHFIRERKYAQALAVIREKVPFPNVLGRICSHPCEMACRRGELNEAVAIRELKRFAAASADGSIRGHAGQAPPTTGKRVAVVGAGPAGLTAAYYLSRQGHSVTVFEALPFPGGMMRFGIPAYRLPREVVAEEIAGIESAGVEIRTNTQVESVDALLAQGFHACLVAAGAHRGIKLPIPGAALDGVLVNTQFLCDVSLGKDVSIGERVVVLGGGNVAFDCARTARRLGAAEVRLACLESRDKMPADIEEIEQAEEEGIVMHPSSAFVKIIGDAQGRAAGVECLRVQSLAFDETGSPLIETVEGSEHILPADTVIFAVGQRPEIPEAFGLETVPGSTIKVDAETLATNKEAVFAAGDAVTGTVSVIAAIAAGRKAAASVDRFLGGDGEIDEVPVMAAPPHTWLGCTDEFAYLERCPHPVIPSERRIGNFNEINLCYDEETALKEAERCLQCDLRTGITEAKFWGEYHLRK